jgi:hypothetical protein
MDWCLSRRLHRAVPTDCDDTPPRLKKGLSARNLASKALKSMSIMGGRVCWLLLRHIRNAVYLASSPRTQDGYELGRPISIGLYTQSCLTSVLHT